MNKCQLLNNRQIFRNHQLIQFLYIFVIMFWCGLVAVQTVSKYFVHIRLLHFFCGAVPVASHLHLLQVSAEENIISCEEANFVFFAEHSSALASPSTSSSFCRSLSTTLCGLFGTTLWSATSPPSRRTAWVYYMMEINGLFGGKHKSCRLSELSRRF